MYAPAINTITVADVRSKCQVCTKAAHVSGPSSTRMTTSVLRRWSRPWACRPSQRLIADRRYEPLSAFASLADSALGQYTLAAIAVNLAALSP